MFFFSDSACGLCVIGPPSLVRREDLTSDSSSKILECYYFVIISNDKAGPLFLLFRLGFEINQSWTIPFHDLENSKSLCVYSTKPKKK